MKIKTLLLITIVMSLNSCTNVNTGATAVNNNTSIVTTRYSSEVLPRGATFQLKTDQVKFYSDNRLTKVGMDTMIKDAIVAELINKGFIFKPEEEPKADFQVGYIAGLVSSLNDHKIESEYGIYPGLSSSQKHDSQQEKGTIIVNIINPANGQVMWRGVGQAFATLKDIPHKKRKERLQAFMRTMFSDLPM